MEDNIYQPPRADLSMQQQEESTKLASTGQRFANFLLDTFFYFVFSFMVGIVLGVLGMVNALDNINEYVLGFFIMTVYYFPSEAIWGRTLAKFITGTQVVSAEGGAVTYGQALGRTLCRFIPFEAFSFLGGKGHPVGWHDSIPKTRVVSLR